MLWNLFTSRLKSQSCVDKKSLFFHWDSSSKQRLIGPNWPLLGPIRCYLTFSYSDECRTKKAIKHVKRMLPLFRALVNFCSTQRLITNIQIQVSYTMLRLMQKCLNGTAPEVFHNYFMKLEHGKATRRNGTDLRMPKVRTESGKRGIYYSGTKIFNDLPLYLKTEKYYIHFKKALKEHFID